MMFKLDAIGKKKCNTDLIVQEHCQRRTSSPWPPGAMAVNITIDFPEHGEPDQFG